MNKEKTKGTALVRVGDTSKDLDALAAGIREDLKAAQAGIRTTVERMGAIGEKLNQAKELLGPRGKWETWVADNTPFKLRTAQLYMRFARELPKAQRVALSTVRDALEQLAPPAPPEPTPELPLQRRPYGAPSRLVPPAPPPRDPSDSPTRQAEIQRDRKEAAIQRRLDDIEDAIEKFWRAVRDARTVPNFGTSRYETYMPRRYDDLNTLAALYLGALRKSADLPDSWDDLGDDILDAAQAIGEKQRQQALDRLKEMSNRPGPVGEAAAEFLKLEGDSK